MNDTKVTFSAYVPKHLVDEARRIAAAQRRTLSGVIVDLMQAGFDQVQQTGKLAGLEVAQR